MITVLDEEFSQCNTAGGRSAVACNLRYVLIWLIVGLDASGALASDNRGVTALDLVAIRDIGGHHSGAISVSPDGKQVAFQLQVPNVERRDFDLTWYAAETNTNGRLWPVGDGGTVSLNPHRLARVNGNRPPVEAVWTPDSRWIVYLKKKGEATQIWRSRWDGEVQEQLTHNVSHVLSFVISESGETLYFHVAEDPSLLQQEMMKEGDHGYLFNDRFIPTQQSLPVALNCSNRAKTKLVEIKEVSIERTCEPPLWVYELDSAIERRAAPQEIKAYRVLTGVSLPELQHRDVRLVRRSGGGRSASWLENENPTRYPGATAPRRLYAAISGRELRCDANECVGYGGVIEGVWLRPGDSEIVFQRADG